MTTTTRLHGLCPNAKCPQQKRFVGSSVPKFCPHCGTAIITACPHCKKSLTELGNYKADFCEFCGKRLVSNS